ncbi:hypothetical protein L3X07_03665 [Levilactobacillus brevis]|nr:hypothetical protein [Levilactobacillus brevis]
MVPVAFVVSDHPLDVAALVAFGRRHLAHYQVPQTFIPVAEIPTMAMVKHNGLSCVRDYPQLTLIKRKTVPSVRCAF